MRTLICGLLTTGAALMLSACGEAAAPEVAASLASKVAAVDAGSYKPETSMEVSRARTALKAASSACRDSEENIADMAAVVKNILKTEGTAVNIVELLEAIPQVLGEAKIDVFGNCSRLLASYAAARKGGQNHMAATNGMRGIVKIVAQ